MSEDPKGLFDAGLLKMSSEAIEGVRQKAIDRIMSNVKKEIELAVDEQMDLLKIKINSYDDCWSNDRTLKIKCEWVNRNE